MNCNDLNEPTLLVKALRLTTEADKNKSYDCFRKLYYDYFVKFTHKFIFIRYAFLPVNKDEILNDSFTDAFISFTAYISKHGFENRGAVATAFMEFCKRSLWTNLKKDNRYNSNLFKGDPDLQISSKADSEMDLTEINKEIMKDQERKQELFEKGFHKLGERCQNLIRWRKLEKLSNEEIASRSGIKENVVTNEIYRCCKKLQEIIKDLK